MNERVEHRAAPPQPPQPTRALQRAREQQRVYTQGRARLERHGMVRGLLLLALEALVFSAVRAGHAGLDRLFVPGWWRQW